MKQAILCACALLVGCTGLADEKNKPAKVLGYQLDISRCKVPTMETLYRMVDVLAAQGYNQLQLYTEHTFAYPQHKRVREEASPNTAGYGSSKTVSAASPPRSHSY